MTLESKKCIAETVQELYLYPYCSKQECTIRIIAWMISWIFGVVIPEAISAQALGGCYFVLSISLLVDFLCIKRVHQLANAIYGLFCVLLVLTALGAIILIAKEGTTLSTEDVALAVEGATSGKLYTFASKNLPRVGIGLFVIMLINLVCVLIEVHKFIYNEDAETKCESEREQAAIETEQKASLTGFMNNLNGPLEGGRKQ